MAEYIYCSKCEDELEMRFHLTQWTRMEKMEDGAAAPGDILQEEIYETVGWCNTCGEEKEVPKSPPQEYDVSLFARDEK